LNTHLLIVLLRFTHLVGIRAARQNFARFVGIESHRPGRFDQHVMIARVLAVGMIGAQQRELERQLFALDAGPMQQAVRVERVVSACARTEIEADARAAFADHRLRFGDLRRRTSIFFAEILDDVFAVRSHLRIQFERMHGDLCLDAIVQTRERKLKRRQADRAPRAGDIGDEIDGELLFHCGPRREEGLCGSRDAGATNPDSVA